MREELPKPIHASYQQHRRQRTTQIILPVVLAVLLCVAMVVLVSFATFQWNGDVGRWAAVSTIWIVMPMIVVGLLFFVLLAGMIYLLVRLLGILPTYTGKAQNFVHMLALRVRGLADASVKPVISLSGLSASLRALLGRK